MTVATMMMF